MARKRNTPAKKSTKAEATLEFEDGYWWIKDGRKKINAGRSERYAQSMLAEHNEDK
jgi:hypothetical protein